MKEEQLQEYWKEDARNILYSYSWLLTPVEAEACRANLLQEKAAHSGRDEMAKILRKQISTKKEVLETLEDGYESFMKKTMNRVMEQHRNELNFCPKCGALCRTPKACLCPRCNHTWFETRSGSETHNK